MYTVGFVTTKERKEDLKGVGNASQVEKDWVQYPSARNLLFWAQIFLDYYIRIIWYKKWGNEGGTFFFFVVALPFSS